MSDRINAITVVLKNDVPSEHAEFLVNAILMLKGVEDVKLNVVDLNEKLIAEIRVKNDLREKVLEAFGDKWP